MRRNLVTIFFIWAVAIILSGCTRNNGGTGSGTGGGTSSSATPAEISSSAQVVKVVASPVQLAANGSANAVLRLSISPGYHVNANPASFSYLIATAVTPGKAEGIEAGKPGYPAAKKQKFEFEEEPLLVYEGDTTITLSLRAESNAQPGSRQLPVTVRVQACDNEKCYPPANVEATIPIEVK
jgi:DsbC/DsbD-like thiol-disulfide interchange protein